jgi:ABC-type branched-subunit amino acid transport system substrate-binding protein
VIDDGYTVDATYQAAAQAGLPVLIDYDGNAALVDTDKRPNVFRIAPPDDAVAAKLAAYVAGKNLKVALLHDDSEYGKDGGAQLSAALSQKSLTAAPDLEIPSTATSLSDKALAVRQSGATGVIIWARAPVLAQMVRALREGGVTAPIFAGPTAEDPVVRTQLADHPEWVERLTYASFRITTETGPYEEHNFNNGGPDYKVGVKVSDHRDVVQPPDWQIFPYDMVFLVKAALEKAGTVDTSGGKIIDALNNTQIKSANGDNRGWKKDNHEGIVDDDIYFASFHDMKFRPVQDDPLSKSLAPIDQE